MTRRRVLFCAVLLLATAAAGVSTGKDTRPTVSTAEACFNSRPSECSGPICSCCYEDGCWICASHDTDVSETDEGRIADFDDCTWDPKARKGELPKRPATGVVEPPGAP